MVVGMFVEIFVGTLGRDRGGKWRRRGFVRGLISTQNSSSWEGFTIDTTTYDDADTLPGLRTYAFKQRYDDFKSGGGGRIGGVEGD